MTFYAYALPHRVANRWLASAGRGLGHRYLRLNVRDEDEAYVLTAPVPGLKKTSRSVIEDVLLIEASTRATTPVSSARGSQGAAGAIHLPSALGEG
jgi:HSP20 family molecular chaperone IbpA